MIRFKSITEERLDFAFEKVQDVIVAYEKKITNDLARQPPQYRKPEKSKDGRGLNNIGERYFQYTKSFVMYILNNGLVASLLFAQGKANGEKDDGKAFKCIIAHLTEWLSKQGHTNNKTGTEAIQYLYNQNSKEIREATLEAIRFMEDLKKVADARLYKIET